MLGAIIGDIVGSTREGKKSTFDGDLIVAYIKSLEEVRLDKPEPIIHEGLTFTDDSVLTLATAKVLREGITTSKQFAEAYLDFFDIHNKQSSLYQGPGIGYGVRFIEWANRHFIHKEKIPAPYGSCGNGSAMRVAPVVYYAQGIVDVLNLSKESAMCTHNHKEGVRGAQALALALFLARKGFSKEEIKSFIASEFKHEYDKEFNEEHLVQYYDFSSLCQDTVPVAIWAALEGPDFGSVMKRCLRIGGDTDTIACMAGALAEILYGIPENYKTIALKIIKRDGPYLYAEIQRVMESLGLEPPNEPSKKEGGGLLQRIVQFLS